MKFVKTSLAFALVFATCALAFGFSGRVVGVADGDTITVLGPGNRQTKVRLYGIDTPERGQAYGRAATDHMKTLLSSQVNIDPIDTDRYGRTVGVVTSLSGLNINEQMVRDGYAWVYGQYCRRPFCAKWVQLQDSARARKAGLWADPRPTAPWEWRRAAKPQNVAKFSPATPRAYEQPLPPAPTSKAATSGAFHGNVETHIFHRSGCRYYNCPKCSASFPSVEQAERAGYRKCKVCFK